MGFIEQLRESLGIASPDEIGNRLSGLRGGSVSRGFSKIFGELANRGALGTAADVWDATTPDWSTVKRGTTGLAFGKEGLRSYDGTSEQQPTSNGPISVDDLLKLVNGSSIMPESDSHARYTVDPQGRTGNDVGPSGAPVQGGAYSRGAAGSAALRDQRYGSAEDQAAESASQREIQAVIAKIAAQGLYGQSPSGLPENPETSAGRRLSIAENPSLRKQFNLQDPEVAAKLQAAQDEAAKQKQATEDSHWGAGDYAGGALGVLLAKKYGWPIAKALLKFII